MLEAVIRYFEREEKNFPPKLTLQKAQAVREAIQASAETPTLIEL